MTDYAIIDSSGQHVGTLATDPITGRVTATVQMLGEPVWERMLKAGWCDVNWDSQVNGVDFDTFMDWFVAGDQRADFNGNGYVEGTDAEEFTERFVSGL